MSFGIPHASGVIFLFDLGYYFEYTVLTFGVTHYPVSQEAGRFFYLEPEEFFYFFIYISFEAIFWNICHLLEEPIRTHVLHLW